MKAITLMLLPILLLTPSAIALGEESSVVDVCQSPRTGDIEKCLSKQIEQAQASLDLYLTACRKSCSEDHKDLAALEAAQKSWLSYVEADCKAQYQHWSDGTMRGAQYLGCKLARIKSRTCNLWFGYLSLQDTGLPAPSCGSSQ
jgi:uncharacterized protein YecT (DUF1311 family)